MRLSRREFLGTGAGLAGILAGIPKIADSDEGIYGFKEFREYVIKEYYNITPNLKGNRENLRLFWNDWEGNKLGVNVSMHEGAFILSLYNSFWPDKVIMYYDDSKDFKHYEDVGIKGNILGKSDTSVKNHYPKLFYNRSGGSFVRIGDVRKGETLVYNIVGNGAEKKEMLKKANSEYRKLLQVVINKLKDEGRLKV